MFNFQAASVRREDGPERPIAAPVAFPVVEPVINKRYWVQLKTDEPRFAVDALVLRISGESVDFLDCMGGGIYRRPLSDVTFYDWTPDAIAK